MRHTITTLPEVKFIIKVFLCLAIGYFIGKERNKKGKNAGVSTYTYVIIGAMLFTFLSESIDPASTSRIAAQIVSGIGFLGAGLIIREGTVVRNLTTAASIWFAGAIGMAIGFEYYTIAIIAGFVAVIIPKTSDILLPRQKREEDIL